MLHLLHQQQVQHDIQQDSDRRVDGRRFGVLPRIIDVNGDLLEAVEQKPQRVKKDNLSGALHVIGGKFAPEEQKLHKLLGEHHHARRNGDNEQTDDPAAGTVGLFQLLGIAGGGKPGKLRKQRRGNGNHKYRSHKPGDAVAVVHHRNNALGQQRSDALINKDIDGVDGLSQKDGQHHHQKAADVAVAEGGIRTVGKLIAQSHQQHQDKLPGIADDHAPAQQIVVGVRQQNGRNDRDVQRDAYHTHRKKAALHLQIALNDISDPQKQQRGDHDGG